MLDACTEAGYERAYSNMKQFSAEHENVMDEWLQLWHQRRHHIFRAFKALDAPNVNMAEIGHAQMASTYDYEMLLVRACKVDIAQAIRQQALVDAFYHLLTNRSCMNLEYMSFVLMNKPGIKIYMSISLILDDL
jgi:hypothetical protein